MALAVVYGFCVLLPAFAFALADGRMAPPCLMEEIARPSPCTTPPCLTAAPRRPERHPRHHDAGGGHGGAVVADEHASAHQHAMASTATPPGWAQDHGGRTTGECCGLFPLMAFADGLPSILAPARLTWTVIPVMTDAMAGRGPDRIIRPPIA